MLHGWNRTVDSLLSLAFFTQHNVCEMHPSCMDQKLAALDGAVLSHGCYSLFIPVLTEEPLGRF